MDYTLFKTCRLVIIGWALGWLTILPLVHSHLAVGYAGSALDQRSITHTIFAADLSNCIHLGSNSLETENYNSPELDFPLVDNKAKISNFFPIASQTVQASTVPSHGSPATLHVSHVLSSFSSEPSSPRAPPLSLL